APHALLERAAGKVQRNREVAAPAGEVLAELAPQLLQVRVLAGNRGPDDSSLQHLELLLEHAAIGELEQADALLHRRGGERAERALDPREVDALAGARAAGRRAEPLRERVAEAAVRFEPVVERDVVELGAALERAERGAEPPRACVRLEGHAVLL